MKIIIICKTIILDWNLDDPIAAPTRGIEYGLC